jgi:hypothetical protein
LPIFEGKVESFSKKQCYGQIFAKTSLSNFLANIFSKSLFALNQGDQIEQTFDDFY